MMIKLSGTQLVSEFIERLKSFSQYSVTRSPVSRNVFKLSGSSDALIYVKGRAEEPHKWGVTKNVVNRLQAQSMPWFAILLFDTPETGFLLTQNDVRDYISSVWPLGYDGDYKPATGTYLANNSPFNSIHMLIDQIKGHMSS